MNNNNKPEEINFTEKYTDVKNRILESMMEEVYSGRFKTNDIFNSLCYTLAICITKATKDIDTRRHYVKECIRVINQYVEDDSLR